MRTAILFSYGLDVEIRPNLGVRTRAPPPGASFYDVRHLDALECRM